MASHDWPADLRAAHDEILAEQRRMMVSVARYNLLLAEANVAMHVAPGQQIDVFGDGTVKPSIECKSPPGGP